MSTDRFDPAAYLAKLTPPSRVPGRSQPDRAFVFDEREQDHELVSGYGDELSELALLRLRQLGHVDDRHIPEIAAHVEMKAALRMQEPGFTHGALVLNGRPCVGPLSCDTMLSAVPLAWTRQPVQDGAGPTIVGYWRHEHGQAPFMASTPEHANDLVDRLLAEPYEHSVAALYIAERRRNRAGLPDHELRVAVNAAADTGGLRYMGGRGTWFSAGALSRHETLCYHHMGWAAPFPRDSELPVHVIRTAVHEFMTGRGRRPACVHWQDLTLPALPP